MFSKLFLVLVIAVIGANADVCGVKRSLKPDNWAKIVGGQDADPGEYPWQGYLEIAQVFGTALCGCSLISDTWSITAAHCVEGSTAADITVTYGEHDTSAVDGTEQVLGSSSLTWHPGYNNLNYLNDIAVFELSTPADTTSAFIGTICLPAATVRASGNSIITGWGTTRSGGQLSDILQEAQVPIQEDQYCIDSYGALRYHESHLCAGLPEGGIDTCQGDSGGPLLAQNTDGSWFLAGLTSNGNGCAEPGFPGIYTEVAYQTDWIFAIAGVGPCRTAGKNC